MPNFRLSLFAVVITSVLAGITPVSSAYAMTKSAAQPISTPGMVAGTRLTEAYVRMIARDTYFWAWPMVNVYNRRLAFKALPAPGLLGGTIPVAPPNQLSMLTDYITPDERLVACPNQDVIYGFGLLALDKEPVVIQIPDFKGRFWVYQVVDLRTDSFADLGAMYNTKPGFYLLASPNWKGKIPKGITDIFHAKTNTGVVIPRVFQDDTAEDKKAVKPFINNINMYPLSAFTGKVQSVDWANQPKLAAPEADAGETKWVNPDNIFEELPAILKDAPPLPGEQLRYAQIRTVLQTVSGDPTLKAAMVDEAKKADAELVDPLLQFHNYGLPVANNWTTIVNGAAFGTDYFTRTAVARSNIFVNKGTETKYYYQDLDATGARLQGDKQYIIRFANGKLPPVKGFWSLTLYNQHHFFYPNSLNRYSVGTKSNQLKYNDDGSLTVYVQSKTPGADKESNWLPAPPGEDFSLYIRAYWPRPEISHGEWAPPAVNISGTVADPSAPKT